MQVSNKVVMHGLGGALIVCVIVVTYGFSSRYYESKRVADGIVEVSQPQSGGSPRSKDFIGACSGMDVSNPEVHLVALSECMGRVRGFVDGHMMTVAMNQMAGVRSVNLWCMASSKTSDQLLTNIMDWADANPEDYTNIRSKMDDENGATAVMIRALHATYPCVNS